MVVQELFECSRIKDLVGHRASIVNDEFVLWSTLSTLSDNGLGGTSFISGFRLEIENVNNGVKKGSQFEKTDGTRWQLKAAHQALSKEGLLRRKLSKANATNHRNYSDLEGGTIDCRRSVSVLFGPFKRTNNEPIRQPKPIAADHLAINGSKWPRCLLLAYIKPKKHCLFPLFGWTTADITMGDGSFFNMAGSGLSAYGLDTAPIRPLPIK